MSNRFFHREFFAKSDDDSSNASVIARVAKSGSDYMSAGLLLSNGYETLHLSFSGFQEDEVDEMVRQADLLAQTVAGFAKALKAEAMDVKKAIKQRTD